MHRVGFLLESLAALQQPFGRALLAESDVADGWADSSTAQSTAD